MMKAIWLLLTYIVLSFVTVAATQAQGSVADEIIVQSWKTGDEVIPPESFTGVVTLGNPRYQRDLTALSGKAYRFKIVPDHPSSKTQNWKIELREVTTGSIERGSVGSDLLYVEAPSEDLPHSLEQKAAIFFPNDELSPIVNKTFKFIGGAMHYPSKTIRKFKVENFLVTLTSGKVTFNDTSKKVIRSWEITVDIGCLAK